MIMHAIFKNFRIIRFKIEKTVTVIIFFFFLTQEIQGLILNNLEQQITALILKYWSLNKFEIFVFMFYYFCNMLRDGE